MAKDEAVDLVTPDVSWVPEDDTEPEDADIEHLATEEDVAAAK